MCRSSVFEEMASADIRECGHLRLSDFDKPCGAMSPVESPRVPLGKVI